MRLTRFYVDLFESIFSVALALMAASSLYGSERLFINSETECSLRMRNIDLYGQRLKNIEYADQSLKSHGLKATPLIEAPELSRIYRAHIYLKLESATPVGAFKIRGAFTKYESLTRDERKRGGIAASSGNHALGMAWSGKILQIRTKIVMPISAPAIKKENTRKLGAEVIEYGDSYSDSFDYATKLAEHEGAVYVHAYEDDKVIEGQGTVGLEIARQLPEVEMVFVPVGGGGLISGIAFGMRGLATPPRIYGVQPETAPTLSKAMREGRPLRLQLGSTLADGVKIAAATNPMIDLVGSLIPLQNFITVSEEEIEDAVTKLHIQNKTAEGAGALSLAGFEKFANENADLIENKHIVLIISGQNIDPLVLDRVLARTAVH